MSLLNKKFYEGRKKNNLSGVSETFFMIQTHS